MDDRQFEEMLQGSDLMQASPQLRARVMLTAAQKAQPSSGPLTLPRLAAAAVLIVALGIAAEAMTRRGIQLALATAPAPRAAQRSEDARPQTVHDLRPDSIRSLDKLSRLLDFHRATPPATGQGDRSPSSPGARLPFDGTTGGDTHV